MLPPGVGALYSPSASFQSLLANISAAQHQHSSAMSASKPPPPFHGAHNEYLSSAGSPPISPQGHPSTATNLTTTANSSISSGSDGASPTDDRRSSSIAALRLKAREHEIRLEMLRQNGHAPDLISWTTFGWWSLFAFFIQCKSQMLLIGSHKQRFYIWKAETEFRFNGGKNNENQTLQISLKFRSIENFVVFFLKTKMYFCSIFVIKNSTETFFFKLKPFEFEILANS